MVTNIGGCQVWPLLPKDFKWRHIQYYITVEPLGFLLYLGLSALGTVQPTLQQVRMCASYQDEIWDDDSTHNTLHDISAFNDELQRELIKWNQYRLATNIPTAIIMTAMLGAWSDKNGRQFLMLMGCAALMIGYCFSQTVLYSFSVMAPLWIWIVTTFFEGLMGNYQLSYFAGQTYQSDICPDKDELTIRMNIVSVFRSIGSGLGAFLTAKLAMDTGFVLWVAIGNTIIFIAFIYIFLWVPQLPPVQVEKALNSYAVEKAGNRERVETIFQKDSRAATILNDVKNEIDEKSFSVLDVFAALGRQYKDCWETFTVTRTGYKRACIWIMVLIGFITTLAGNESASLWGTYTRFIMNWSAKTFGYWNMWNIIIGTVGQFIGILVLKSFLKMRDTWILILALLSFSFSFLPQATTSNKWWNISNFIQFLAAIITPTTSSLASCFVKPHEVGRVLIGINTSWYLAVIGSTYGLQFVYEATLDWWPGFMFIIVFILNILCVPMLIWIDFVEKESITNMQKNYDVDELINEEMKELDELERRGSRAMSATNRGAGISFDPTHIS